MSNWTTTTDSFHKLGKSWVRQSAIEAVEPASASEGSLVHLASGAYIRVVSMTPDQIIARIAKGDPS